MGVSLGRTGRSGIADPNVTPMIDVLLVLLVIFMVAERVVGSFDLQLPRDGRARGVQPALVMEIEPGGSYAVDRQPISRSDLGRFLTRIYAGRPEKVIFVKADGRVRYGEVMYAIDVARGAGVKVVGAMYQQ